jgi:acyl-CoA synthetase (NDP forming)
VNDRETRTRRLHRVLAPKSIALIGAKDSGRLFMGTGAVLQALERLGFEGEVHLVNRGGVPVNGAPATRTLVEAGARVDMAAVLVPAAAIPDVLPDIAAAGAAGATLLASGLAESGPAGAELQDHIGAIARDADMELIGPNCLGFLNLVERTGVWFSGYPEHLHTGAVAVLSQSGGVGDAIMEASADLGIGLSHVITTGNEPTLAVSDVLEYLLEQEGTRSVAIFAEAIRKPDVLVRAAARARELGKAIVMLKAGSSDLGARNAVTHTGSLAGNDAVMEAALAQLGIIRVESLEQLLVTAHLAASVGPLGDGGVGVVSLSGGGCSVIADAAEREGLDLPEYSPATTEALKLLVGDFATVQNPFDVTAAAGDTTFEDALSVVSKQENVAAIAVLCNVPTHLSGATPDVARLLRSVAAGIRASSVPAVLIGQTAAHGGAFGREVAEQSGVDVVLPGIGLATAALARVSWWSRWLLAPATRLISQGLLPSGSSHGEALSEWDSRLRLEASGVPLVTGILAGTPAEALDAWRSIGGPVALKGVSAAVAHKSEIGAVVLGADDEHAVLSGYEKVEGAIRQVAGDADGVLVSPMVSGGVELVAGVTRDPVWGPTLVVGLGGVLVEVMRDAATRVLPVDDSEVRAMLESLRGFPLLTGVRGRAGVDLDGLVRAVSNIAEAGSAADVVSLEVNPLLARADGVIGLDALVITAVSTRERAHT